MKSIRIILIVPLLVVIIFSCKNNPSISNIASNDINMNLSQNVNQQQVQKITYIATTRGFYEKIDIVPDSLTITNERDGKNAESMHYSTDKWNDLLNAINEVGVINIETFEAPTQMHQVDGAAMAHIEVHTSDTIYRSKIFDHGHPSKQLSTIYKAIQSLKESILKQ